MNTVGYTFAELSIAQLTDESEKKIAALNVPSQTELKYFQCNFKGEELGKCIAILQHESVLLVNLELPTVSTSLLFKDQAFQDLIQGFHAYADLHNLKVLRVPSIQPEAPSHPALIGAGYAPISHIMFLNIAAKSSSEPRNVLTIRPMTHEEFTSYQSSSIEMFRKEIVKAKRVSEEESATTAQATFNRLLPQGLDSPNTFLLQAIMNGQKVGHLWIAVNGGAENNESFIYDVEVVDTARGLGIGQDLVNEAIRLAEISGDLRIGLNVFGYNTVAKNLYEKLGFQVISESLYKELGS